jgi:hypothetical protein
MEILVFIWSFFLFLVVTVAWSACVNDPPRSGRANDHRTQ